MTYNELKTELDKLNIGATIESFGGFEESFEYEHFKTVLTLKDEPNYTLMQFKDSDEFNTSSETWLVCIPNDEQLCVIDMGTEEDMCDQFFSLMEIFRYGFGTIKVQKKEK